MPSESFPVERIALVVGASLLFFCLLRLALEKVVLPLVWSQGWAKLDAEMRRAFVMRVVSVTVRAPRSAERVCAFSSLDVYGCGSTRASQATTRTSA